MSADAIPTPIAIDKVDAFRLVSSFFLDEWATTDIGHVHTKEITGGFMNSLQLIWRDTTAVSEPSAVLIRHFGRSGTIEEPPSTHLTLSAAQQAIVYWEMSRRSWGPKIYGFFSGGRLEEYFVDSRTLTAAECLRLDISRDVAKSYARLHSLQLPLRRDSSKLIVQEFIENLHSKGEEVVRTLRTIDDPRATRYASMFERTDWVAELKWVMEQFSKHSCKITATHGDTNHLNVLVCPRTASNSNTKNTNRIVLIDYETVSHHYRGFDLGGHFAERMYCYSQTDTQLSGFPAPNEDEQRAFCEAYVDESRELGEATDVNDTVEHLMLEAKIGRLFHALCTNMMCTVFDVVEVDPLFLEPIGHMMEMYTQLKEELLRDRSLQDA